MSETTTLVQSQPARSPTGRQLEGMRVVEWEDQESWDDFVHRSPGATMCHMFGWKSVVERVYGHKAHYLAAHNDDGLQGVLPLVLTRSPLFGKHLTSMPFLDSGGIIAQDHKATELLLQRAETLSAKQRASLCLRYREDPGHDLPLDLRRVSMMLELSESIEEQWTRLSSERRNRIRKGHKSGLQATMCSTDGLQSFYDVFAANMRDLGSPVHSLEFFAAILNQFPDQAAILLVRDESGPVGAAFCFFYQDTIAIPWVSSLRSHFRKCPNQVLYWEAIRFGVSNGYRKLDFGRSAMGDGTYEAKRQWGASPVQLHWICPDGTSSKRTSRLRAAAIWRRLPLTLATALGPSIRKGIPG